MSESKYILYTDGSFRRPDCGSWAYVLLDKDEKEIAHDAEPEWDTTISRMELLAIIRGLEKVLSITKEDSPKIVIYSDSQYAIKSLLWWIKVWVKNDWKNPLGEPIKNRDLMERMHHLRGKVRLTAWHVKGHSGNKHNDRADALAQQVTRKMKAGVIKRPGRVKA